MSALDAVLRELLRLYDWRNELGKIERDFNHDKKQMKTWLNQYGREKKAAWAAAREVLGGGETAIRGSQSSPLLREGEIPSPATNKEPWAACMSESKYCRKNNADVRGCCSHGYD